MKKLMIAAAAAAMIGGVQADLVYDFSASLKTTTAKTQSQSTTYTYYFGFGQNETTGEWWYDENNTSLKITSDGKYFDWSDGTYSAEKLIKRTDTTTGKGTLQTSVFNKLSQDAKEAFVASMAAYGNYYYADDPAKSCTDGAYILNRAPNFEGKQATYGNKKLWCMSVKWTYKVTNQACYRTCGTVKLAGKYTVDADKCCDPTTQWSADWSQKGASPARVIDDNGNLLYNLDMTPVLSYRFGSITLDKATKVEFLANIGDPDGTDPTKLPYFVIAGQGSAANLKDKTGAKAWQISSISGNIVGVWLDPLCEVCCGNNPDAVVFDCAEDDALFDSTGANPGRASKNITVISDNVKEPIWGHGFVDVADGNDLWGTAAYGSFTLKYNQKESEFR